MSIQIPIKLYLKDQLVDTGAQGQFAIQDGTTVDGDYIPF